MKLNTIRAWKDEVYRQSLSNEQMGILPANPVGELELTDASLEFIYGGGGGGGGGFAPRVTPGVGVFPHRHAAGASSASSATSAFHAQSRECFHSFTVEGNCNERAFSLTFKDGFSFLSPVNAFCINDED